MATRRTLKQRNADKSKGIQDRLPSIMGWFSECSTFMKLSQATSPENLEGQKTRLGFIRGPEHAAVDGGIIVNPPEDFPFGDLTAAWQWAQFYRDDPTSKPLQVYRLDAKLGPGQVKPGQWVHFFVVTAPGFPHYICIVPTRSYSNLFNVYRRRLRGGLQSLQSQLRANSELVFNDLLAPYAVHENDIYTAFTRIIEASHSKTSYINPTNGVVLHGWTIPDPDTTVHYLFEVREKYQGRSKEAIERFQRFLGNVPGMHIALNPVGPLVCDMFLVDEVNSISYNIEHKHSGEDRKINLLSPIRDWNDPKFNWHFLFNQRGEELAIHVRCGQNDKNSGTPKPRLINMAAEGSGIEFSSFIRTHGNTAKSRLRTKWKNPDLYDETLDVDVATNDKEDESGDGTSFRQHSIEIAGMGFVFRDKMNEQCCNLRQHACVLLHNHPCAHAVIIEHKWTDEDEELYRNSGVLPVSLVGSSAVVKRCILLRFISHRMPPKQDSTSQLFELATKSSWDVPVCTAQDFVFVAMTGGIPIPDELPSLETLALFSSTVTTLIPESRACARCDDRTIPRDWSWTPIRVSNTEMGRANKGKHFSLTAFPFLKPEASPLKRLHTLSEGSVHQFFCESFEHGDERLITTVHGSTGLLQRQWNHGDSRISHEKWSHPTYGLLQRILSGVSLQSNMRDRPFVSEYDAYYQQIFEKLKPSKSSPQRQTKMRALEFIVNKTERGIMLRDLVALSGFFTSRSDLHCDACPDEASCKFLHPAIAYTLSEEERYSCGNCYGRQKSDTTVRCPCTFRRMPAELVHELRNFPAFRAHVPCHECWKEGKLCDNNSGSCWNCIDSGVSCAREACAGFHEPRDSWFCPPSCDKAHHDDGYTNIATSSREDDGFNMKQAMRRMAQAHDERSSEDE